MPLKILLVAFACHPKWGSESAIGWRTALALSREHLVHVLTHTENREAVNNLGSAQKLPANLSFSFFGRKFCNHPNRLIARGQSWLEYFNWLKAAPNFVAGLCQKHQIDLVHHLTVTTWRTAPIKRPPRIPLVWGPLGGTALTPFFLMRKMSLQAACFEILRNGLNRISCWDRALKKACRETTCIVGVSQEAALWMGNLVGRGVPIFEMSAAYFHEDEIQRFRSLVYSRSLEAPLKAFAGGNIIGSKGVGLALEALKIAKNHGTVIPYTVASSGPETKFLKKLTARLGVQDQVTFCEGYEGAGYEKALREHSVCLLPSFREGSSITLLEAMLSGQVPVVAKASTPGEIVGDDCGFAVKGNSAQEFSHGLAEALIFLAENPHQKKQMAVKAHEKIAHQNSEDTFCRKLQHIYEAAVHDSISACRARKIP